MADLPGITPGGDHAVFFDFNFTLAEIAQRPAATEPATAR